MTLRYRIGRYLLTKGGVKPGEMLPRWGHVLAVVLFPGRIFRYIVARVWDFENAGITVEGIRVNLFDLREIRECKKPTDWYRVVEIKDGYLILERKENDHS